MKHVKGRMILGKEGMPQYATRGGQQLDQKVNESLLKGPMISGKEGMPQYATPGVNNWIKSEWPVEGPILSEMGVCPSMH